MLQEAGIQTERVSVSNKDAKSIIPLHFYNALAIGEKCVNTSDLFTTQSPTEVLEPKACIPE